MRKRLTIGNKLYLSVVSLFLIFAVLFIVFQQYREKQYKIDSLNLRLQDFNNQAHEAMVYSHVNDGAAFMTDYLRQHERRGLRVTIIKRDGSVVFDNMNHDYRHMANHSQRPEVVEALRQGSGSTVDRNSATMNRDYFYSATYYRQNGYIIRSALPYDVDLAKNLRTDQHYMWFALVIMALLTFVLYSFIHRIDRNISKLNNFAARADQDNNIELHELGGFSADEIGETAERIVKLYLKLQRTQHEQEVLKRQLTQNAAHELKTPVASIQGYLETILENPKVDDKLREEFLKRCYAQSQRLTALISDMSMLSRLDDGAQLMTFENVDVSEIIRTVVKESQLRLKQKNMTMQCDIPDHIILKGNHSLIYSIFRNLTDNAIAYAGNGRHIFVSAKPTVTSSDMRTECRFVFSDDGVGVAEEHLARIFERFYRVDKGRSRKMGGTGLGLAIVKNAVFVHGGSIKASNNPSGGLRFDFSLKGV